MDTVSQYLSSIPEGAYYALVAGLVVSLLLQFFKKWLQLQSDKVITFLLMCFSFASVAIDQLTNAVAQNPQALGGKTFLIMGIATTLYRYLVKPASTLVSDAKEYRLRKERLAADQQQPVLDIQPVAETETLPTPAATTTDEFGA